MDPIAEIIYFKVSLQPPYSINSKKKKNPLLSLEITNIMTYAIFKCAKKPLWCTPDDGNFFKTRISRSFDENRKVLPEDLENFGTLKTHF